MAKIAFKYAFVLFLLLSELALLSGQNIVSNPGFEQYRTLSSYGLFFIDEFQDWKAFGFSARGYSTEAPFNRFTASRGYHAEDYLPHKGKAMTVLTIWPNRGPNGSAGYVQTKLKQKLKKDQLYSIKYWVKIKHNFGDLEDLDIFKKIGVSFSDKSFDRNFDKFFYAEKNKMMPDDCLEDNSSFLLDTVQIGEWMEVRHFLRPLVDLEYAIFGWIQNPNDLFSLKNRYPKIWSFEYFIDQIEILEIEKTDSTLIKKVIEFPSPFEAKAIKQPIKKTEYFNKEFNIHFDIASSLILESSYSVLDSVKQVIEADSFHIYKITGHTDSFGEDNIELSIKRANSVKKYLLENSNVQEYQLITSGKGSDVPVAENTTDLGRRQNRRVEIKKSKNKLPQLLYHQASKASLTNKPDSAFIWLKRWMQYKNTDKILLLYDPDLTNLHNYPEWNAINFFVKKSYGQYKDNQLAWELDNIFCTDLHYLLLPEKYKEAKGYIPEPLDVTYLEFLEKKRKEDKVSTKRVSQKAIAILENMSEWPAPAYVGERPANTLVQVLIYCEDAKVMEKYLPMVKNACEEGKIKWKWYAKLFDKHLLLTKDVQKYGTQYQAADPSDPFYFSISPIEDQDKVNMFRSEVDLPPITIWEYRLNEPYTDAEKNN